MPNRDASYFTNELEKITRDANLAFDPSSIMFRLISELSGIFEDNEVDYTNEIDNNILINKTVDELIDIARDNGITIDDELDNDLAGYTSFYMLFSDSFSTLYPNVSSSAGNVLLDDNATFEYNNNVFNVSGNVILNTTNVNSNRIYFTAVPSDSDIFDNIEPTTYNHNLSITIGNLTISDFTIVNDSVVKQRSKTYTANELVNYIKTENSKELTSNENILNYLLKQDKDMIVNIDNGINNSNSIDVFISNTSAYNDAIITKIQEDIRTYFANNAIYVSNFIYHYITMVNTGSTTASVSDDNINRINKYIREQSVSLPISQLRSYVQNITGYDSEFYRNNPHLTIDIVFSDNTLYLVNHVANSLGDVVFNKYNPIF